MKFVRELCAKYKLYQRDIARYCRCSTQSVRMWCVGSFEPNSERVEKLKEIDSILSGHKIKWRGQALELLGFPEDYE